eukprot:scaffold3929_cov291-Pinguiococcus_pyrenoidosus.AAC.11
MLVLREREAKLKEELQALMAPPAPVAEEPEELPFWEAFIASVKNFFGVDEETAKREEAQAKIERSLAAAELEASTVTDGNTPPPPEPTLIDVQKKANDRLLLEAIQETERDLEETRAALRQANEELDSMGAELEEALEESTRCRMAFAAELKGLKGENSALQRTLDKEALETKMIAVKQKSVGTTFVLLSKSVLSVCGKILVSPVRVPRKKDPFASRLTLWCAHGPSKHEDEETMPAAPPPPSSLRCRHHNQWHWTYSIKSDVEEGKDACNVTRDAHRARTC